MTSPNVPTQLETALDELAMAHETLTMALKDARQLNLAPTYLAAIEARMQEIDNTIDPLQDLVTTLHPYRAATKP